MFLGIGYGIPFSFLGTVLVFVAFTITLLIIVAIQQILKTQNLLW
ncbi:MAG: hypothetical protein M0T74_11835 [Desulfitobacterium hafniense]|nr:hypothetical protein [Desulfitobacterium hafniense]